MPCPMLPICILPIRILPVQPIQTVQSTSYAPACWNGVYDLIDLRFNYSTRGEEDSLYSSMSACRSIGQSMREPGLAKRMWKGVGERAMQTWK